MKLQPTWASNDLYSSGPDNGTATKVDPTGAANGLVRGTVAAAQHINFLVHPLSVNSRRAFTTHCLALKPLDVEDQDDLTDGLAVVAAHVAGSPIVVAKASSSGVAATTDGYCAESRGVLNQITDGVAGGARGPSSTRSVVIGLGGTGNTFTTNNGDGWSAGASTGLLGDLVAVVATSTNFIVCSGTGGSVHGTGAGAWTGATALSDIADVCTGGDVTSLAALTGGIVVAVGSVGGAPKIARSTNTGLTWAAASGAIPNAADHVDSGWVTGDEGATLWHAGYQDDFVTVDIAVSTDGNTWTARAQLTSAITGGISGIRIWKCPTSDLLVMGLQHTESVSVYASTDGGVTWSEPQNLLGFTLANLGVCGGRLFGSRGVRLFASDGVGSEG